MSSSEKAPAYALAARLALRDYLAVYPPRIIALTVVPRALLQVAFFCLIGLYVGGREGLVFAYIGATAHVAVLGTIVRGPDALVDEKAQGTMYRLRLARPPLAGILIARWWVSVAEGLLSIVLTIVVLGVVFELVPEMLALLPLIPLHVVIACSMAGLGLFGAAVSAGRRADVLVTNVLAYVMLLLCGVIAPLQALGILGYFGLALPLTNGLLAIRAVLDYQPWMLLLAREVVVGAVWYLLAIVVLKIQSRRALRHGHDDFM